ncbi:hypothetical protein [Actinoplanes sp. NPDC023714]|uniref:hypothetical protein n=1 Tax=Actinoplanes sp. NPDC023714 TaxID=3154322 RepID=UPI0033F299DC
MLLPEAPLVDGRHLLERPGFWAWLWREHLIPDDDNLLEEIWSTTDESFLPELLDESAWPVIRLPLASEAELAVVFRNDPDDGGIDYLLLPGGDQDSIPLAALDGHQTGPAFSWQDLRAIATHQPTPRSRAQALLLLMPAFGDESAATPEATATVAEALRTLGATGPVTEVAEAALSDEVHYWGHTSWHDAIPDADDAPRNPASAVALPPRTRALIQAFLAP